jgi:hypothetical protein
MIVIALEVQRIFRLDFLYSELYTILVTLSQFLRFIAHES